MLETLSNAAGPVSVQQLGDLKRALDCAAIVATTDVTGRITYVNVTVEGPDVTLTADQELIAATVMNLLLNAAQAMDGHGRIAVGMAQRDQQCVLEIRDNGPGITAGAPRTGLRAVLHHEGARRRPGTPDCPTDRRTPRRHAGTRMSGPAERSSR